MFCCILLIKAICRFIIKIEMNENEMKKGTSIEFELE